MKIIYEGFFIEECEGIKEWLSCKSNKYNEVQGRIVVNPDLYHVTTEFRPEEPHTKWYGEKVKVSLSLYKPYSEAEDTKTGEKVMVEAFKVQDIITSNSELKNYLDTIKKQFHITISYSRKAVDSNYIDWDKESCNAGIGITMVFGGYTADHKVCTKVN